MAAINFPDSPAVGQQFVVGTETWTWDGVKWTAFPGALSIPDAPTDGQVYGRQSVSGSMRWAPGVGGVTDAPTGGLFYGRRSGSWVQPLHTDITDWAVTLANYVPLAGTTMTGLLILSGDPTANTGAATKQYADNLALDCGTF